MKILAVLPLYPPRSRVGAWLTTHEYLAALAARGHHVDVMALMALDVDYDLDGVHVHGRSWRHGVPDLVVSHAGDRQEGARYASRIGVPSVRFCHGHHKDTAVKLSQLPTALAVFASEALRAATRWDGPSIVCHPPVRAEQYRTNPGDRLTLINMCPEKGSDLFWDLAAELPRHRFLAVKGGYGRQDIRQRLNVLLQPVVRDMRVVYGQTRILLMPSEIESYGRVAVEAACSGIPTIAHPSPGLVEAMGDHATWVDRDDLTGWVAAITELSDPGVWTAASHQALEVAAGLTPDDDIAAVCDRIEALAGVPA